MSLLNKALKTIQQYNLLSRADSVVIGVSGGPDSVCLAYLFKALKNEYGLRLHIAHLDHRLRPQESGKDAEFAASLAVRLGIPATIKELEPGSLRSGPSLEEQARKARLDFFCRVARNIGADKIALGHNLDDQAETVLMRVLRGSGLLGLSGILPAREIGGFTFIRPLIEIKRREIERFLKAKKIKARIDSTNLQEAYFRNRIRLRLMPELERYNPNIKEVLANTAQIIAQDYDYLQEAGSKAYNKAIINKGAAFLRLSLPNLLRLHPALRNMVWRLCFEALRGNTRRMSYQHIKELNSLIYVRPKGSVVDLPSSISVKKEKTCLVVYNR